MLTILFIVSLLFSYLSSIILSVHVVTSLYAQTVSGRVNRTLYAQTVSVRVNRTLYAHTVSGRVNRTLYAQTVSGRVNGIYQLNSTTNRMRWQTVIYKNNKTTQYFTSEDKMFQCWLITQLNMLLFLSKSRNLLFDKLQQGAIYG